MRSALVPILLNSVPGWVRNAYPGVWPSLALAAHYDADQYWIAGIGQVAIDQLQTCTRAATKYVANSAGILVPKAVNINPREDLGLLVEQAATNLALQSQALGTTWVAENSTITVNNSAAPDGTTTGNLHTENTSSATHDIFQSGITLTGSATYTTSVWAKAGTNRYVYLNVQGNSGVWYTAVFDLQGGGTTATQTGAGATSGTVTSTSQTAYINGWYRLTLTGSGTMTSTTIVIGQANAATGNTLGSTNGQISYLGSSRTVSLWGAQLELGSFATSYIPTTTVSVTRAADAISLAVNNSRLTIGSLYTKVLWPTFNGTANIFVEGNNGASLVGATLAMTTATNYEVDARNGATAGGRGSSSGNAGLAAGASARLGVSWDSATTPNGSFNGAASSAFGAQSEADWAGNSLSIGSRGAGNSLFANTYIQRVAVWYGQKLSAAQLAALP